MGRDHAEMAAAPMAPDAQALRVAVLGFIASLGERAAGGLMFWLLARGAGAEPAGVFALCVAYVAIFGAVPFGLDELAQSERDVGGRGLPGLAQARLWLAAVAYAGLWAAVRMPGYGPEIVNVLSVFGLTLITDAAGTVIQSLSRRRSAAGVSLAIGLAVLVIRLGGGAWAWFGTAGTPWSGTGLMGVAWWWVAGGIAGVVLSLVLVPVTARGQRDRGFSFGLLAAGNWRPILRTAAPVSLMAIVMLLEWEAGTLLLATSAGLHAVGWYSAAMFIFVVLWMIPQAYRVAVYPEVARLQAVPPGQLERLYRNSLRLMLAIALPMGAGLWLLAPGIITRLYGDGFMPAVEALRWLGVALVPLFLSVSGARLLVAKGRQAQLAWFATIGLVINIAASIWLIPGWGPTGAALARVLSALALWSLQQWALRRYVPFFSFPRAVWRTALATAVMVLVVVGLRWFTFGGALVGGAAVYGWLAWRWVADERERTALREMISIRRTAA